MTRRNVRYFPVFLSLALFALTATILWSQTTRVIDVEQCRPLWYALDALENLTGIPINYEDVPYQNMADVQDFTTPQQLAGDTSFRELGPPMARLRAEVQVAADGNVPDAALALSGINALLNAYRQQKLPGDFKVEQANGMIYVTANKVLGADGVVHDVLSPLLTSVTIPVTERNVADTMQAILDAVYSATKVKIVLGRIYFWPTQMVTFGATREPARDVLARLFAQVGAGSLSYRMNFDPIPNKRRIFDYMLNLRSAPSESATVLSIGTPAPPAAPVTPAPTARPAVPAPRSDGDSPFLQKTPR